MSVHVLSITLHARHGNVADFCIRKRFFVIHLHYAKPVEAQHFVGFVLPEGHIVFRITGYHTGAASSAFVKINDHPVSFCLGMFGLLCHQKTSLSGYMSKTMAVSGFGKACPGSPGNVKA
jgi:hypothetical protein